MLATISGALRRRPALRWLIAAAFAVAVGTVLSPDGWRVAAVGFGLVAAWAVVLLLRAPVPEPPVAEAPGDRAEFLAAVGHEIRTPLHGWSGLVELLEDTPLDERQRHWVGLLRSTAHHLTRLVGDILDIASLDAGRFELESVAFGPAMLARELAAFGEARAAETGLAFAVEVDPAVPPAVIGDPRAIRQVLFNFVDNAFKYTRRGRVTVRVEATEGGALRFTVADTGPGMSPARRAAVFQRAGDGSGLGLVLCRRLAEAMGGRVGVDGAEGRGSAFWIEVSLPLAQAGAVEATLEDGGLRRGARVLFADDVELNRLVFRDFLDGTGCVVDEARDGAEAAAKAAQHRYDLIVLDLRMPEVDGFEAARRIRADELARGQVPVPLVALTAGSTGGERRMAHDAGFDDFLAKPIARQALLTALGAAMSGSALRPAAPPPPPNIPAGLEHLMPAFLAEMAKDAERLQVLAGSDDRAGLAEFAHAVRGKCAMFGEDTLFALYSRLEDDGAAMAREEIDTLVEHVVERVRQLAVYEPGAC
ncbi:MAG: ATP-binding protein [Actinomycetota bacterium]